MTNLAYILLSMLTIGPGVYTRHIRDHALPPQHRAQQIAEYVEHASIVTGISRPILAALWFTESTLNPKAEHKATHAYGIGQLLPGTPFYNQWTRDCARDPYACEVKGAEHSARALKAYLSRCGTMARALAAYRIGHCMPPGPKTWQTIRLAQRIESRLRRMESSKRSLDTVAVPE